MEDNSADDVQLVATTVAKILRDEHFAGEVPKTADYRLGSEIRFNGSTDLNLSLKVGKGLVIEVHRHWSRDDGRDLESLNETAGAFAADVAAVHEQAAEIVEMEREVRTTCIREFAKARRRGLPYRLVSITPTPLYDDVADGVGMVVEVVTRSEAAQLTSDKFGAERAEDVVEALEEWREEQQRLADVRFSLDHVGATGKIDGVVVNALREAGYDVGEVLRQLAGSADWIVDVGNDGDNRKPFRLYWKNGHVFASLTLADGAQWGEGRLILQSAPASFADPDGRKLCDLLPNPIFGDDVRVRSSSVTEGGFGWVTCEQENLLFDAESGKLWAA